MVDQNQNRLCTARLELEVLLLFHKAKTNACVARLQSLESTKMADGLENAACVEEIKLASPPEVFRGLALAFRQESVRLEEIADELMTAFTRELDRDSWAPDPTPPGLVHNRRVVLVQIERASPDAWYGELVGCVFRVVEWGTDFVVLKDYEAGPDRAWRHISRSDCVVMGLGQTRPDATRSTSKCEADTTTEPDPLPPTIPPTIPPTSKCEAGPDQPDPKTEEETNP